MAVIIFLGFIALCIYGATAAGANRHDPLANWSRWKRTWYDNDGNEHVEEVTYQTHGRGISMKEEERKVFYKKMRQLGYEPSPWNKFGPSGSYHDQHRLFRLTYKRLDGSTTNDTVSLSRQGEGSVGFNKRVKELTDRGYVEVPY